MRSARTTLLTGLAALLVVACQSRVPNSGQAKHQPRPPLDAELEGAQLGPPSAHVPPPPPPEPVVAAIWSDAVTDDEEMYRVTGIALTAEALEQCGVEEPIVFFANDGAQLGSDDEVTIDALARCLLGSSLVGERVIVVGYADPLGTELDNLELARRRALAVAERLAAAGVPVGRIRIQAHGERGAHDDPGQWPLDRRVEVRLVPVD